MVSALRLLTSRLAAKADIPDRHVRGNRTHLALLAGTDFLSAEVLTLRGLVTHYVPFFIHLESRRVDIAGITVNPDERWMQQMARNVTVEGCGALRDCRYLLHDRDAKSTQSFRAIIASGRVEPAHASRAQPEPECLCGALGQVGEGGVLVQGDPLLASSLRRALSEYVEHFHAERNHQGKGTSCCSLGARTSAATALFNAASDWADSCVITIRRQRERGRRLR
jgi:hypothetical protein